MKYLVEVSAMRFRWWEEYKAEVHSFMILVE